MPKMEKLERVIHSGGMTDRLNSPASCPTGLMPGIEYPKQRRPGGTPLHLENQFVHPVHNPHSKLCNGEIPKPRLSEAQPWDPRIPHNPVPYRGTTKPNKSSLNVAPRARLHTSLGQRPRYPNNTTNPRANGPASSEVEAFARDRDFRPMRNTEIGKTDSSYPPAPQALPQTNSTALSSQYDSVTPPPRLGYLHDYRVILGEHFSRLRRPTNRRRLHFIAS
jgi:hypothetical protein